MGRNVPLCCGDMSYDWYNIYVKKSPLSESAGGGVFFYALKYWTNEESAWYHITHQ